MSPRTQFVVASMPVVNSPTADCKSPDLEDARNGRRVAKRARGSDGNAPAAPQRTAQGERDEDGELIVLGEAHLAALAHNTKVRSQLRSGELQRLLRMVDSSRSRMDALEAALLNIPEFKTFCDEVIQSVAAADRDLKPRLL